MPSMPHRLVVHGAAGRMGQRVIAAALAAPEVWNVVAAIERADHLRAGEDVGVIAGCRPTGVVVTDSWDCPADVVIDFSLPEAVGRIVSTATSKGVPVVVATTGLTAADHERIAQAAQLIPVLQSPSMSLAVNISMDLVGRAASLLTRLGTRADVEIIECHHRHKEDAPSGTALKFGAVVRDAMGQSHDIHGRRGRPGARPAGEIGYHAVRAGDNPGEHTILFGMDGESFALNVRATSRDCYAGGALAAAAFLAGKPPGLYSMRDVLGLA